MLNAPEWYGNGGWCWLGLLAEAQEAEPMLRALDELASRMMEDWGLCCTAEECAGTKTWAKWQKEKEGK